MMMQRLVLVFILASLGVIHSRGPRGGCPSACRCEGDGRLRRVDCVDLGLSVVPSNLSGFTSYLDLSLNKLSALPAHAFASLHNLQELRLAGNGLTDVPKDAFAGLINLKVLMLQNNHLQQVPPEALENLRNLQSLRLDANSLSRLPASSLRGLASLRHLWLDDNLLSELPVGALSALPGLQAVTLALNNITRIPDRAFHSLRQLVVLHLHDNQIHSLGESCFSGLHNLETLDLSSNRLDSFPAAIRSLISLKELNLHSNNIKAIPEYSFIGNPSLETINIQNNPVQTVGGSAFQQLAELRTLSLSGTSSITAFPDLSGTNRLETLSITATHISFIPSSVCQQLPNLHKLDLSHNLIQSLPSFSGCRKLQNIDLRHNSIHQVRPETFRHMKELRSLDLTSNRLSSVSLDGLQSLTHLKLAGNLQLRAALPLHQLPRLRVAEMPFAFQCCVFLHCVRSKSLYTWNPDSVDNIKNHDPEDLTMEFSVETRPQPAVRCSPTPAPPRLCQNSSAPWLLQFSVSSISILSIAFNSLVLVSVFLSSAPKPPARRLLGVLFWLRFLAGLSGATLDVTDVRTAGCFEAPGSGVMDFLFALSSEACVFLMMAIVFEHENSMSYDFHWLKVWKRRGGVQVTSAVCCTLALAVTALPLVITGEISLSSPCVSFSHRRSVCWGYNAALVLFNAFCYLFMTVTHTFRRRHREKVTLKPPGVQDRATTRLTTFLLLTNSSLSLSATLLSFSSLLRLPSLPGPEVDEATVLLIAALPACLDPLLYMFLSPHFREELRRLLQQASYRLKTERDTGRLAESSEDAEKLSCKSMQTLVSVSL
ncbi:leucine-rich repeat-containing G-protein coupled receptor 5-like [Centroberyx affinis]|uniref:leucine-rich repeat-containing G-protein coupled receptor 5-like n=1 Tax=Centroberyx affinis TaxID=166261 RepID=UPI003A5C321A